MAAGRASRRVASRAQLNYAQVNQWLEEGAQPAAASAEVWHSLQALRAATARMREWRGRHQLLMRDEPEFDMTLGEDGRIEGFVELPKGPARTIVEEAMVATNQAVARHLAEAGVGLFASHAGFRSEKLGDARELLAGVEHQTSTAELQTLDGYRAGIVERFTAGPHSLFPESEIHTFVGGGDADDIIELLPRPCTKLGDLVLRGLAVVAVGGTS